MANCGPILSPIKFRSDFGKSHLAFDLCRSTGPSATLSTIFTYFRKSLRIVIQQDPALLLGRVMAFWISRVTDSCAKLDCFLRCVVFFLFLFSCAPLLPKRHFSAPREILIDYICWSAKLAQWPGRTLRKFAGLGVGKWYRPMLKKWYVSVNGGGTWAGWGAHCYPNYRGDGSRISRTTCIFFCSIPAPYSGEYIIRPPAAS